MSMDALKPNMNPTNLGKVGNSTGANPGAAGNSVAKDAFGPSFEETLKGTLNNIALGGDKAPASLAQPGKNPADLAPNGLKFSNHAIERMVARGIQFDKAEINKLNEVVEKAAAKGAKDSLILTKDSALIVSVKNKTVVTVMDKANLKENVFTNIDSTIVM